MRLVFRPQAQDELLSACDWYEDHQSGLGAKFALEVDSTIRRIVDFPRSYPHVHGRIRRAVLRRFPYAIFFRLIDDEIVILGVVHGRRDPRSWQSRR